MKQKLTPRQQEVLDAIKAMIEQNGWPPTRVELAKHFGFASPNAAQTLLEEIARKGHITITPKVSRGIRIAA
ncbi:hypothetical protein [Pseudomonas sp. G34]|uniref:LexA family protein n=1 Tax=Pseudomonas sp. G34 TaxID=3059083 RepID=UPI0035BE1698